MSNYELQQLKALALAATPGPWKNDDPWIVYAKIGDEVRYLAKTSGLDTTRSQYPKDASFIAAANPAVILALIAKVEATASSANGAEGLPELPEPFDMDMPELHTIGLGCGVEDRSIHDRYEAAEYGWRECYDAFVQVIPVIYTADQMQAYARAAVLAERSACAAIADRLHHDHVDTKRHVGDAIRARK